MQEREASRLVGAWASVTGASVPSFDQRRRGRPAGAQASVAGASGKGMPRR